MAVGSKARSEVSRLSARMVALVELHMFERGAPPRQEGTLNPQVNEVRPC